MKSLKFKIGIVIVIIAIAAFALVNTGVIPFAENEIKTSVIIRKKIQRPKLNETKQPIINDAIGRVREFLKQRKIVDAKIIAENIMPPTQESFYYRGLIAAFLNEQSEAKDMLTKSIALGTDERLKANSEKVLNRYRDFELARDGRIEYLQTLLSYTFNELGEYGLSIELAFDALKTKSDYRDAWMVLGHSFLNETAWLDAADAFTKALNLDSGSAAAYFFRGIAHLQLKKNIEAKADFEKALSLGFKPHVLITFYLAETFFNLNDYERAYPLYKEAISTDPSDIQRFIRPIALAINHLNKPQEALQLAQKAYEAHPDTAWAHNLIGWAYIGMNNFNLAHEHLEQALQRDQKLDAAYLNLGQLYEREGDEKNALRNYDIAIKLAENNGNDAISETARIRYDRIVAGEQRPVNITPQDQSYESSVSQKIPSLSLE